MKCLVCDEEVGDKLVIHLKRCLYLPMLERGDAVEDINGAIWPLDEYAIKLIEDKWDLTVKDVQSMEKDELEKLTRNLSICMKVGYDRMTQIVDFIIREIDMSKIEIFRRRGEDMAEMEKFLASGEKAQ